MKLARSHCLIMKSFDSAAEGIETGDILADH